MTSFLVGIGSQRAGSTLLHKVLDECSPVFMHPVKELHYYDTLFQVRSPDVLVDFSNRQLNREIDRLISAKSFGYIDKKYQCFIRANKILANNPVEDIDYIDLFRPCISGSNFLGEITPEYMILPEEGVAQMAKDLGRDTHIILISRDPVERFLSAFKLLKNYDNPNYDQKNFERDLELTLDQMPEWIEQQSELNDYESALNRFGRYFDNILFLSFEKMIEDPDQFRCNIEDFLNIDIDDVKFKDIMSTKVNSIGNTASVNSSVKTKLARKFKDNKQFLLETFK